MEELVHLWIEALESGEWHQVNGRLKEGNTYCCLGVLCDISKQDKWRQLQGSNMFTYKDEAWELPVEVRDQAKLVSREGYFTVTDEWWNGLGGKVKAELEPFMMEKRRELTQNSLTFNRLPLRTSLTYMNDFGISFDVIAEVIKSEPPDLFEIQVGDLDEDPEEVQQEDKA